MKKEYSKEPKDINFVNYLQLVPQMITSLKESLESTSITLESVDSFIGNGTIDTDPLVQSIHRIYWIRAKVRNNIYSLDKLMYTTETIYYYYLMVDDVIISLQSHTKDVFKGDMIDFEGKIFEYDAENMILFCQDSIYKIHEV